jgi:hypothetical protein
MPIVFSYGTLQQDRVQLATFGRLLEGTPDALTGVEPALARIEDQRLVAERGRTHNADLRFNGRPESRVAGTAFEITDAELVAADAYERLDLYRRVWVTLASGRKAWVFVHADSVPTAE